MPGPTNLAFGNISFHFILAMPVNTASVGANTTAERTFTVPGLLTGDLVFVNKPSAQTGLGIVNARVSAADTVAITYMNNTGGGITPTVETYVLFVVRDIYDIQGQVPTAIG